MNDYSGMAAGLGLGIFIIGLIIYLAIIALSLWIGYLIMRTAVKNGILLADEERLRRGFRPGGGPQPPMPPQTYR